MHLLCGAPDPAELAAMQAAATAGPVLSSPTGGGRDERIEALEAEVERLRGDLERLWELTGLADQRDD
jgi:hypothetical protein